MRTTCAVINSPARISLRVKLSSNREAKLSNSLTAALAFIYEFPRQTRFGRGLVKNPERGARCGAHHITFGSVSALPVPPARCSKSWCPADSHPVPVAEEPRYAEYPARRVPVYLAKGQRY